MTFFLEFYSHILNRLEHVFYPSIAQLAHNVLMLMQEVEIRLSIIWINLSLKHIK